VLWRYSSTLSLTLALDVDAWTMPHSGHYTPVKYTVPIVQDAGWDSEPLWTGAGNVTRTGIRSPGSPTSSCVTQSTAECLEIVWPFGTCSSIDGKSYSEGHITLHSARPERPWAHPASCKMGTGYFPGVEAAGCLG
jgi:hypothetical protein